jgi:hypothetical protein
MKSLLLSTLLMVGCAGGQVLKGPDRQDPPAAAVEQTEPTENHNHIYAFIIWITVLGAGVFLFIRNERSPKK